MGLLEIVITIFFLLLFMVMLFYIMGIGRIGIQFFKYNMPFSKKRGTFYLIRLRNGRFRWVYDRFKSVWRWPDKTNTYISKNFDRLAQTTEPLIFLVEGYPTNVMLADLLPKEEMSELVNNIIKEQELAARLEMDLNKGGSKVFEKVLPVLTLVFAGMGAIVGLAIMIGLGDLSDSLETLNKFASDIKPHIPELIKALERLPREI